MIDWPITLPLTPLVDGYSEKVADNFIRTRMSIGPAKIRRRTTAMIRKLRVSYILDKYETAILDSFYSDTLKSGSLSFYYTHPRTSIIEDVRFIKPPEYGSQNGEYFRVLLQLEILP